MAIQDKWRPLQRWKMQHDIASRTGHPGIRMGRPGAHGLSGVPPFGARPVSRSPVDRRLLMRTMRFSLTLIASLALATFTGAGAVAKAETVRFGVPTWPGVTVKSEVAAQLMQTMGYETTQKQASPAFAINALKNDDLDVYLGGWMPTEKNLINPAEEAGKVEVLTTNISDAHMAIAVPSYVWEAGVRSEADLDKYADKFGNKIYGIEPGSGFNDSVKKTIKNGAHGLDDWELVPSSTSAMLSQVGRKIQRGEWIVFLGWEPHWMNVKYDLKYPKAVGESEIAGGTSDVLTVVNPALVEQEPMLERFLSQYVVTKESQSKWVLEHERKERAPEAVAEEWIGNNLDKVGQWLEGVETRSGEPAIEAVRAQYGG
jgi:glycine betaine/proline transport system substrate-binding protein